MERELRKLKSKILYVLKKHKVTKAGIFGSFARGESNRNSDIDILVEVDKNADLIDLIRLRNALRLKVKRKIDLVEYDSIRKELKQKILSEEIPILR